MYRLTLKCFALSFLLLISLFSKRFRTCDARHSVYWRGNRRSIAEGGSSGTLNVLDFGAKGDGRSDDTKVNKHFYGLAAYISVLSINKWNHTVQKTEFDD